MELDFNKIIRLKKIRIEKSELSEEEKRLDCPNFERQKPYP